MIGASRMVLPVRIELTTSPLPRGCSTTELRQHQNASGITDRWRDVEPSAAHGSARISGRCSDSSQARITMVRTLPSEPSVSANWAIASSLGAS